MNDTRGWRCDEDDDDTTFTDRTLAKKVIH